MRRHGGFTLIEVLVALAVVAVALVAGLQASGALTRAATRQGDQWLAQLCAENELTRLRLMRQLPGVGESTSTCEQAGQSLQVRLVVVTTPNPNFRRIDAVVDGTVDGDTVRLLTLSTVMGRY
ncbi:MAG: type II secretion system minor pseudopilin GspI [Hydrogenophaga sp.]